MIVNLTKQDRERLHQILDEYDRKIAALEESVADGAPKTAAPADHDLQAQRPAMPEPIGTDSDGFPIFDDEAVKAWQEADKKITEEIDRRFDEWLSSGSKEWQAARLEKSKLFVAKLQARDTFFTEIAWREFQKLGGDREKILLNAKEQVALYVDNRYEHYQNMIRTRKNEVGDDIESFSGADLRVDGTKIYLDAATVIRDCKESLLKIHYAALENDAEAIETVDNMILSIVSTSPKISTDKGSLCGSYIFKKKRKPRSRKHLPIFNETDNFSLFATTPLKDTIYTVLDRNGDVESAAKTIHAVSKDHAEVGKYVGDNMKAIKVETDHSSTIVELLGSAIENVNSQSTKKILHFIESKIYESIYYKGHMNDYVVTFSLRDMVNKKLYSTENNARRAFKDASSVLTAIRVSASLRTGKQKSVSVTESANIRAVLFPTVAIEKGLCAVRLNPDINWTPYLKDFVPVPDSWYALPDNAADLEYKIFRALRQNKSSIDKTGRITVNLKLSTVAEWLNLPLEPKDHPKKLVKTPIENAVKQIADSLDKESFKIEIVTDLGAPIKEYLAGYLRITASGSYTENLSDLAAKQQKRIETAISKKDEIVKEASIRRLAEDMKEGDESSALL